jgi:hypothetical protein
MEPLTKSAIIQQVVWSIDHKEDLDSFCILKKTNVEVHVRISFKEQEVYVDANGVKWVRA